LPIHEPHTAALQLRYRSGVGSAVAHAHHTSWRIVEHVSYHELVDLGYAEWLLSQSWLDPVVAARLRAAVADYRDDNREDELSA
jgi:hypothetical protein